MLKEIAKAKLNLTLEILVKRDDNYHDISSLMVFCDFGDFLTLEENNKSNNFKVVSGDFKPMLEGEDNIIVNILSYMQGNYKLPFFNIELDKNIPVGAGLGGGSADAAALLRLLSNNYLTLSDDELRVIGKRFGADIPACISSKAVIANGIGEDFDHISDKKLARLKSFYILLVNPLKFVSTKDVFNIFDESLESNQTKIATKWAGSCERMTKSYLRKAGNDLTNAAISICPEIADILKILEASRPYHYGMSGSGATCYGIYNEPPKLSEVENYWHKITKIS